MRTTLEMIVTAATYDMTDDYDSLNFECKFQLRSVKNH
jgi:hypothetical protein